MRRIRIYSYTKRDERRDPAIYTMTKTGKNKKKGCNLLELRKSLCTIETNGGGQRKGTVESMKSPQN